MKQASVFLLSILVTISSESSFARFRMSFISEARAQSGSSATTATATTGAGAAPENFIPPEGGQPSEKIPSPAPSASTSANSTGGSTSPEQGINLAPPGVPPPPKDLGLKDPTGTLGLLPTSEDQVKTKGVIRPFDFEAPGAVFVETLKRDIFYYRGLSDFYRKRDSSGEIQDPDGGLDPLTRFDLDNFEVLGIMWDVEKPKAIIRDPVGRVYNVTKGAKIGLHNGSIVGIREGEVIIMEYLEEEDRVVKKPRVMVIKNKIK